MITYIGTEIQKIFHLPQPAVLLVYFYFIYYYNLRLYPITWVEDGANFLLKTMVFFFVSCRYYGCCFRNYAKLYTLFAVIIIGTCIVALSSGYIAEKCLLNINIVKV